MKIPTGRIILCLLIISISFSVQMEAQQFIPTTVEISSEKINVQGKLLYVHKVLKGQTLYSVSKAYKVPIDIILRQNPSLKDGLKTGAFIYIPVTLEEEAASVAEIKSTPSQEQTDNKKDVNRKKYKKYTVKWYENLNDVAKKHNVSIEAIIDLNNLGKNPVISKRQVLLIPDKNYIINEESDVVTSSATDTIDTLKTEKPAHIDVTLSTSKEEKEEENSDIYWYITPRTYTVSIILPFNSAKSTQNVNVNFMDFYSGALLAFKDFQKETGIKYFKLNPIDLSAYNSAWELLSSGVLDKSEIIIGPVYDKNLSAVAQYAMSKRIPIVSPMDTKAEHLVDNNPFFFQYPVSEGVTQSSVVNKIASSSPQDSIKTHLYFERGTSKSPIVTSVISDLNNRNVLLDTLSYGILEGRGIDTIMLKQMDTLHLNRIIVASESEAFVSDVLRNLLLLKRVNNIKLEVYGRPRWKNFEIIELEYFHLLNIHLSLQYHIDYNNIKTREFITEYIQCFKAEPSPFSFQGYDILTYFFSVLNEFGREFPSHVSSYKKSLLQSDIYFVKKEPGSGFENRASRNIVYQKGWIIKPW